MCRIYNRMRAAVETDYVWVLEDDVIPPEDVLHRLMHHFRPDVGAVAAPYRSRLDGQHLVWDRELAGAPGVHRIGPPAADKSQAHDIRGAGFGCLILRTELLRQHIFSIPRGELCFDIHFFKSIGSRWRRVVDWTCEARHLSSGRQALARYPDPVWFRRATVARDDWTLDELYALVRGTFSDISEHVPVLRDLASRSEHVTEFGTRFGVSTVALLAGRPQRLVACDPVRMPTVDLLSSVAGGTELRFVQGDSRQIEIEETDLLLIDTLHDYDQLKAELDGHAAKVRRWIVLHDTETYKHEGENGGRGLWPAVEELIEMGEWRVAEHHENNNGLTVLERIVYTPGVTLITPTGDRPEAFALCERWIKQQTYAGPLQWIVVDDGKVPTQTTLGQEDVRREPQPGDPPHTLCLNMRAALPRVKHDKVLVIEDDDYYAPRYVETMAAWLEQADLVGEVGAKYYYLDSRSFYHFREHQHASWCRTGFRPSVIPTVWREAKRTHQWSLDLRVWEAWPGSKYRWVDESGETALCIGVKGMPGRPGATWKTGRASYADPKLDRLKRWLREDWQAYESLLGGRARVKAPSANIVVYTAVFGVYDEEEAEVCIRTRRDDADVIRRQVERYRAEAFSEHAGLPHGGLLVRKRGCEAFNQFWWDEVLAGSCRDQISFPYAVRRSGVRHLLLPRPIEEFTERLPHKRPCAS